MMETRIPMGISEFFRMTRQPTSAQMRKMAPTRAQRGTSLLWSVPKIIRTAWGTIRPTKPMVPAA